MGSSQEHTQINFETVMERPKGFAFTDPVASSEPSTSSSHEKERGKEGKKEREKENERDWEREKEIDKKK